MPITREQVCELTARRLAAAAPTLASVQTVIGLDGFVDNVVSVVDKRRGPGDADIDPVRTVEALGRRLRGAGGGSSSYELVVTRQRMGGAGPVMASALAALGLRVTYIGNVGYPDIHPAFEEFARRVNVVSIADPGVTDALEFEDGQVLLGKHAGLKDVNWDTLLARVGKPKLKQLLQPARLIGMVNWTMLPHMTRIWARLLDEVIPNLERHQRKLFIDLADPEKRSHEDVMDALKMLSRFQDQVDVVLGLNLKESLEVADVLGLPGAADPEDAIEDNARAIREQLNLSCVVIHPRRGAAAAVEGESARFSGPFVREPRTSAGAGDHFNAGFCLGQLLGFGVAESLCAGVATSGYYVRQAASPTARQLAEFIADLPKPQA